MSQLRFSPLESALLDVFHSLYAERGFPPRDQIVILSRENTGAGRYVGIKWDAVTQLEDGYIDLGGRIIKIEGARHGLMAVILIKDHRLEELEIVTYGSVGWDGVEENWSIGYPEVVEDPS